MNETLLRYGTDKPDLRFELEIADLGEVLARTEARVFRQALDPGGVRARARGAPRTGPDAARARRAGPGGAGRGGRADSLGFRAVRSTSS